MNDIDPAQLPWSLERLAGLGQVLLDDLEARGVDPEDPVARAVAEVVARWIWVRASALSVLDVVEALGNAVPPLSGDMGGPIDSALRLAASPRPATEP